MALLKGALRKSGVYFATALEDMLSPVLIEEGGQQVQVFLLPYFDCPQAREFLGDTTLRGEAACMEKLLGRLHRPCAGVPLLLRGLFHQRFGKRGLCGGQRADPRWTV